MIFFGKIKFCKGKKDICDADTCVIDGKLCKHFSGTGTNLSDIICNNSIKIRGRVPIMNGQHPCNICTNRICKDPDTDVVCAWDNIWSDGYCCFNYDCMLNYEGSCIGSFYGRCGCQE